MKIGVPATLAVVAGIIVLLAVTVLLSASFRFGFFASTDTALGINGLPVGPGRRADIDSDMLTITITSGTKLIAAPQTAAGGHETDARF